MEHTLPTLLGGTIGLLMVALIGFVIGAVAKALMPGPDSGGIFTTILLGIGGSFLGEWVSRTFHWGIALHLIASVLGAMFILLIYRLARKDRHAPHWR